MIQGFRRRRASNPVVQSTDERFWVNGREYEHPAIPMPHGDEPSGKTPRSVIPLFEPAHLSVKKKIVQPRDDFCGLNLPIRNRLAPPEVPIDRESWLVKTVARPLRTVWRGVLLQVTSRTRGLRPRL